MTAGTVTPFTATNFPTISVLILLTSGLRELARDDLDLLVVETAQVDLPVHPVKGRGRDEIGQADAEHCRRDKGRHGHGGAQQRSEHRDRSAPCPALVHGWFQRRHSAARPPSPES